MTKLHVNSAAKPSASAPRPQPCVVLRINHFDPLWRRCWDRDTVLPDGRRIKSYRDLEAWIIEDDIRSCSDGVSCFVVESAWVLRHYLERHPEHLATIRRLVREGRFELLGAGENIVDTNMIHGELLVRNLVLGTLWAQKTLKARPTSGWVQDTFGTSAQVPQIFRQCGYPWLAWIIYDIPDKPYWRGLDGSVILCHRENKDWLATYFCQGEAPFPFPCSNCQGTGCKKCKGRGMAGGMRGELAKFPSEAKPFRAGAMWLYGEELLPGFNVAADLLKHQATSDLFAVRQGTFRDLGKFIAAEIGKVDHPPADQIAGRVENNPVFTGCYVSRIRIKQEHRRAEHMLLAAEHWDAVLNNGAQANRLREAWRTMTLSGFHDAITSTHSDPAYEELMDLLAGVKTTAGQITAKALASVLRPEGMTFTVFNRHSMTASCPVSVLLRGQWAGIKVKSDEQAVPVYEVVAGLSETKVTFLADRVPALGAKVFECEPASPNRPVNTERKISMGAYQVRLGEHGIEDLQVEGVGPVMASRSLHLGELVLEMDVGNPWYTKTADRRRVRLAPFTGLEESSKRGESIEATYRGEYHDAETSPAGTVAWRQQFRLYKGVPWLQVKTVVDWQGYSRRLRIAFPSATKLNRGIYEIPYGVMERERYDEPNSFCKNADLATANGDWPAIHWAGIQAPDHVFAVLNQGTPSYRIEDGIVWVSLLRSPQSVDVGQPGLMPIPNELKTHVPYEGLLHHGSHVFYHALYIGKGDWRQTAVSHVAEVFNDGLQVAAGTLKRPLPGWSLEAQHTRLTALKKAEDNKGIVIRLVEQTGRAELIRLHFPDDFGKATLTNLLEEPVGTLAVKQRSACVQMDPWKIVTVRIQ